MTLTLTLFSQTEKTHLKKETELNWDKKKLKDQYETSWQKQGLKE